MIQNKKVVAFIFAGRKKNLEILLPYLLKDKNIIDEVYLCLNTNIKEDIEYIYSQQNNFFKIKTLPKATFSSFYRFCNELETVYIKIDDDICFIEENTIRDLVNFKLGNPNYFLVYPNIINNVLMTHLHQRMGCFNSKFKCNYYAFCENGLKNPKVAEEIHSNFFERNLEDYKFNQWIFSDYERISINFVVFLGRDIQNFDFNSLDDERHLSQELPYKLKKHNIVYGKRIVSHFSYGYQRPFPNENEILAKYYEILNQ